MMTGSAKQIAWAERIKADAFASLDRMVAEFNKRYDWTDDPAHECGYDIEAVDALRTEIVKVFSSVDSASMIIDRRGIFEYDQLVNFAVEYRDARPKRSNGERVPARQTTIYVCPPAYAYETLPVYSVYDLRSRLEHSPTITVEIPDELNPYISVTNKVYLVPDLDRERVFPLAGNLVSTEDGKPAVSLPDRSGNKRIIPLPVVDNEEVDA